ncbi:glycerate kinase [Marinobacterium mangrovicola]|uniref:Glycerate kinase n=1 Tax=Marinobacterium mangrovicola TaxID=1476959 RepID=A0A4R1GGP6_9GAMM|nr:glycerate kinase [Marinobacterium mangrovicola]TCK07218.1 glycerate kinase [Marinobacterium mangrovicola]
MKIVIAPDSFKESLSASEAAALIAEGIAPLLSHAELIPLPVADGGEGTSEALVNATDGQWFSAEVSDPLGRLMEARWALLGDGETAVIDAAAASGLDLLTPESRNPWLTTTRGTGELILAALDQGAKRFIIGLGGSATNDAGAGMLQALGARLLDQQGQELQPGGGALSELAQIDLSDFDPRLQQVSFEIACDVDNPLIGENGASAIFGPQKGADPEMVLALDANLGHFGQLVERTLDKQVINAPGAGAAGGLGAAFLACFNASLKSGVDIVLDAVNIEHHLGDAQLVITGEGRIDGQSLRGKTPIGVARRARKYGVPVVALAGSVGRDIDAVYDEGITAVFSIVPGVCSLDEALKQGPDNLRFAAESLARMLKLSGNLA